MTLRLNGSTSGYTGIDAPAVAGNNTLILPGGNGTADQALVTNGSGTLSWADRGRMVLGTAQNSTSGTSIDFTGIPSWVKRVTVMFNGVSTNGTSVVLVQLGNTSFVTSGYASIASGFTVTSANTLGFTTGFSTGDTSSAAMVRFGAMVISNVSGNTWVADGGLALQGLGKHIFSGGIALSGTLDRVRITTVNGTDTFDAGSINILYEG